MKESKKELRRERCGGGGWKSAGKKRNTHSTICLYKQTQDHQDLTRLQALWLLRQGRRMKEIATIVEVHHRTLQEWVACYQQGGVAEVLSLRHGGHGGQSRWLTPEQEAELEAWASQGECRTIWDAVHWVEQQFDVKYSYWGMRWVFERLELKKKKMPRRIAPQASVEDQEAWKKGVWRSN